MEPSGLSEEEFFSGDTSRSFDATVAELERLTSDIMRIRLRLDEEMAFTAGQFVNVEVPGSGEPRTYSMANGPDEPRVVELICRTNQSGLFSGYLARAAVGDAVRLRGPYGQLKIHLLAPADPDDCRWIRVGSAALDVALARHPGLRPGRDAVLRRAERG